MAKTPLLLIGGGGHCASVIDVIEAGNEYEIVGIIEASEAPTKSLLGYKVIGSDDQLPQLLQQVPHCVITVGQIKPSVIREMLFNKVKRYGGQLPVIISPLARVAHSAKVGEGTVIMHHAIVNHFANIGRNAIVNHKALIEHGAMIGNHTHIATAAVINGDAVVGNQCFIGSGAILIQGVSLCDQVLIGAGAVVTQTIHERGTYVGCPAKRKGG